MPSTKTKSTASLYSVHPGIAMMQKWIQELPEKSGKSLEQWIKLVKKEGPPTEKERREWLKKEHGFGTNSASWIAEKAEGKAGSSANEDPEAYLKMAVQYVEDMYAGARAALRPVYDALLKLGLNTGAGARACPCKTMVPLYRNHVFAQIKPTTNKRIDMGFALKDTPPTGRLIDTGGFAKKDRITHRIPIGTLNEIDDEVKRWLKVAYDMDA